jgi:peptidylprolyl isomerase
MRHWFPAITLAGLLVVTAGCGEQSPTAGADGGATQTAAEPGHEGHAHGPGEGHGEEPAAGGGEEKGGFPGTGPWAKAPESKYKTTDSGLTYAVLKEGKGDAIAPGKTAVMHYTGWLKDGGMKFDSSRDRGQPFSFGLGAGEVIAGWDEGVAGMKVGEQRQLVIPAKIGYGPMGRDPIPGGATLVFDVELVKIEG